MSRKLQRIKDWTARAHAAKYCVNTLAENCGISVRTLERHIRLEFASCPHVWLVLVRMQRAMGLLLDDSSVKETAFEVGYGQLPQHFSRDFKQHFGYRPTQVALSSQIRPSQMD